MQRNNNKNNILRPGQFFFQDNVCFALLVFLMPVRICCFNTKKSSSCYQKCQQKQKSKAQKHTTIRFSSCPGLDEGCVFVLISLISGTDMHLVVTFLVLKTLCFFVVYNSAPRCLSVWHQYHTSLPQLFKTFQNTQISCGTLVCCDHKCVENIWKSDD